jgi:hypothetical protein
LLENPSQLAPGLYTVEVSAEDRAGNSAKKTLQFGFSSAPELQPTVVSVTPRHGQRLNTPIRQATVVVKDNSGSGINLNESNIVVSGPAAAASDQVEKLPDTPAPGQATLIWNFARPFATDGGSDGEYAIQITVVDNAGNAATPPPTRFFFDTTPPKISAPDAAQTNRNTQHPVEPPDGAFLNRDITRVSVTLTDPAGIDLEKSVIELQGPSGAVAGRQLHNGVDTLILEFPPLRANGKYQIRVRATDVVGNTSPFPLTSTFSYDTQPPVIRRSTPGAGATINSPLAEASVVLDDQEGSGVDIEASQIKASKRSADGSVVLTVPGRGSHNGVDTLVWTFDAPLASDGSDDGVYIVEVAARDRLGTESVLVYEFNYTVRAPALASTTPDSGALLNSSINQVVAVLRDRSGTGLNADASNLLLRRTAAQGGLSAFVGGSLRIQVADASDPRGGLYTFAYTLERALASDGRDDGVYTIEVSAVDNGGSAAVYTVNFVYDTQAPRLVETQPATGAVLNEALDRVEVKLADSGAAVNLVNSSVKLTGPSGSVPGRQTNNGGDTINWEFAPLKLDGSADGVYTITAVPVDLLGNRTPQPIESRFTLDTTPPSVETNPAGGAQIRAPIRRVEATLDDLFSGVDHAASEIRVFNPAGEQIPGKQGNDGQPVIFWEFDAVLADDGSADGRYTIEVVSQDILGNRSAPLTRTFEYRSKTPLLAEVVPKDGAAFNAPIETVSVRLEDQSGTGLNFTQSSLTVTGPGVSPNDRRTNNGRDALSWTFAEPLATDGGDDGVYTVAVTAAPNVGGRATYTTTFTYDTTAPVVVATQPKEGAVLVEGVSEVAATLADASSKPDLRRSRLQLFGPAGSVTGAQTTNGVDALRLSFDRLTVDGEYTISVQPWDILGNTPPTARRLSFLIDTTPPNVVSTQPASGETLIAPIDFIVATLNDSGAGVNVEQSTVRLTGPNGFDPCRDAARYSLAKDASIYACPGAGRGRRR